MSQMSTVELGKRALAQQVDRLERLVESIACQDYRFEVRMDDQRPFLQLHYQEPDVRSGELEWQHSRKWLLSPWMTDSEVVQTALKAALTSAEHRTREHFRYRDRAIFSPHWSVEWLWEHAETAQARDTQAARWSEQEDGWRSPGITAAVTWEPEREEEAPVSSEPLYSRQHLPGDPVTWPSFRKKVTTRALRVVGPFTVQTSEGPLRCQDGWLCVDARGYPYPVADDEFQLIYEPAP